MVVPVRVFLLGLVVALPPAAQSTQCWPEFVLSEKARTANLTVNQVQLSESDVILVGRVKVVKKTVLEASDSTSLIEVRANVESKDVLKGTAPARFVVYGSASSCGCVHDFAPESDYLIFLTQLDGVFSLNSLACSRIGRYDEGAVQQVRKALEVIDSSSVKPRSGS